MSIIKIDTPNWDVKYSQTKDQKEKSNTRFNSPNYCDKFHCKNNYLARIATKCISLRP